MEAFFIVILAVVQVMVIAYVIVLLRRIASALGSIANSLWAIGKSLEKSTDKQQSRDQAL